MVDCFINSSKILSQFSLDLFPNKFSPGLVFISSSLLSKNSLSKPSILVKDPKVLAFFKLSTKAFTLS